MVEFNKEETALWGRPATDEEVETYFIRQELVRLEMESFFDSLPAFIHEDDYFALWMMGETERAAFIEANRPQEDIAKSAYFQRTLGAASKPVTVGGFRI